MKRSTKTLLPIVISRSKDHFRLLLDKMPIETDLAEYISDIDLEDSDDECDYPEIDEQEFENAAVTSGWMKLNTTPTISVNQESELWEASKQRIKEMTRKIALQIWISNAQGWKQKLANKQHTWAQIFSLCFPSGYFNGLKAHILEVTKESEWEPSISQLVQFIAVELSLFFHGISPER